MPADLVFQPPASDTTTNEAEYVCKLKEAIIRAHEIARQKLKTSHSYMKRDYDVRIRQVEYKPGDLVYILNMANRKGKSKKNRISVERAGSSPSKNNIICLQSAARENDNRH